ncbi:MAG TPA: cation diffusion facilitator family transporter [Dokdonella sp.]|uniref:cation diffusion facilitator family transporter n=1 Tax=Dokdonella sp. TaxID=2291710 RepID=UPI002D7F2F5C|nr:cation diffusion facilitator family transporter [Dokdonella sp.]HET9033802.1 cation diffusion facilitator family transporter [Dokdonella sp.]
MLYAFALTTITMVVEAFGGWISGSLALLADAGHMLVDAAALLFAWLGAWFARRPADSLRSFGYARLEVLVGYTNSLTQILLVAWIVYEALSRFLQPAPILSGMMFIVAVAGLLVNLIVLRVLGGHEHDDLNTAAARLHVIGDLLGSVGAVAAALAVRYLDWLWADPLISIFVSLLILNSAIRLLRRSAHILLEGVPEGLDVDQVRITIISNIKGIREIHHVHLWQLGGGRRMATLHARLHDEVPSEQAIRAIQDLLKERFSVAHATVQIDAGDCDQDRCREDCQVKDV